VWTAALHGSLSQNMKHGEPERPRAKASFCLYLLSIEENQVHVSLSSSNILGKDTITDLFFLVDRQWWSPMSELFSGLSESNTLFGPTIDEK
jgi:hypothetical protein